VVPRVYPGCKARHKGKQWAKNRLLTGVQEVIVVELRNFLDIVHFFAYRDHILLVFKHGYETGQAATLKIAKGKTKTQNLSGFLF